MRKGLSMRIYNEEVCAENGNYQPKCQAFEIENSRDKAAKLLRLQESLVSMV
jgi:hypothetical protein